MKRFQMTLGERDRKTLLGGIAVSVLVLLFAGWQFLSHEITSLEHQVAQDRTLLAWMQAADSRLRQAQPGSEVKTRKGTLPASIQSALERAGMASHLAQLRQNENGSVQLSLNKVDFDQLATLLGNLQKNIGATIIQTHITRVAESSLVNATMVLQES